MTEPVDWAARLEINADAIELLVGPQTAKDLRAAAAELRRLQDENNTLRIRAVTAEHHKALDRLGRSSYQEVVEDKLRTELAETQVRAEQAEAEVGRLREAIKARTEELTRLHGTAESCGWYPDMTYQYDMEFAAAFNELKRLAATRPTEET